MYQDWMKKIPVTGTIEDGQKEKEYPHIIEKLDPWHFYNKNEMRVYIDKINEIIEVVNIMNRGGRKL